MKNTRFSLHSVVAMGFPFFSARLFFTFHWIFFPARQANLLDSSVFPQPTAACSHTSCRHFLEIFIFRTALFFTAEENRTLSSEVFLRCGEYSSPLAQTRRAVDISLAIFSSPFNKKRYFLQFFILICCKKKTLYLNAYCAALNISRESRADSSERSNTRPTSGITLSRLAEPSSHSRPRRFAPRFSSPSVLADSSIRSHSLSHTSFVGDRCLPPPHSGWEREKREIVQIIVNYALLSCCR